MMFWYTEGSIYLAASSKQTAKCKVSLNGLIVNSDHLQKMFQSLVGLLVKQEIQPLEVVDVERWRRIFFVALPKSTHRPAGRSQEQEQSSQ